MAARIQEIRDGCPGQLVKLYGDVIEPEKIRAAEGSRERIYTAPVTVSLMVDEALSGGGLRGGVLQVQAARAGGKPVGSSTGSYSKARGRLALEELEAVNARVCSRLDDAESLLGGRRILVVDGTGISLDDTAANQEAFPQPTNQAPGCGHPVMQVVALMRLSSGAFEHACISPLSASESGLFYCELIEHLRPGDVLVADRGFSSFVHYAELARRGVDALMRLHGSRPWPKSIRADEGRIIWTRPRLSDCPEHVTEAEWAALPQSITVRYLRRRVQRPGFRDQVLMVATTLLDEPAEAVLGVYLRRWDIELRLADLKTTLAMEHLRAKTPAMARKLLIAHLIAYHLIRLLMRRAQAASQVCLTSLSFKGALDALLRFLPRFAQSGVRRRAGILDSLYHAIASDPIPSRPGRIEPRVLKKRPKGFPLMTRPRAQLRQDILASMAA